jgi:hypothetical protein
MASETNITLTTSWQEVADGAATIALVTGGVFWINVGASAPTDDTAYFAVTPDEKYYSYPGTQKIYAKIPTADQTTIVSPTEIS